MVHGHSFFTIKMCCFSFKLFDIFKSICNNFEVCAVGQTEQAS